MCRYETTVTIYVPHMNPLQSGTRNTGIHALHTMGICSCTNMHATIYIPVPLHCYHSLHADSTLHIIKNNKLLLPLTYIQHTQITSCASLGEAYQYIPHNMSLQSKLPVLGEVQTDRQRDRLTKGQCMIVYDDIAH